MAIITNSIPGYSSKPMPSQTVAGNKNSSIEEFKDKLRFFVSFRKNTQQIAADLTKITPKGLELEEIVNCIFNECGKQNIPILLNAILSENPSFTLSGYDKIRRAIVEDGQHLLTNSSLRAMFKEHKLDDDKDKIASCYDLAYRMDHPHLYRLSEKPVLNSEYSLNFLWVNLNPQDRIQNAAQNIFNKGLEIAETAEVIKNPSVLRELEITEQSLGQEELDNWKKIKKSFTYRISKWADVNPNAQINLWYDSALVTQQAQQKTFEMMKAIAASRNVNLKLRDIRQLPNISDEIRHSLHPGSQLFYRVDILKALIAEHIMIDPKEVCKYVILSDVDVEPMPPEQIFDQRTVDFLSSHGYVFNRVSTDGDFENSFFIFNKENENLKKIHHETIINQTESNIKSLRFIPLGNPIRDENILSAQFVFKQYSDFRRKMNESYDTLSKPRKVVKCPNSQFSSGGNFSKSDFQAETFRFIGSSNVPYTTNGRNSDCSFEQPIDELTNWNAEPLALPVE